MRRSRTSLPLLLALALAGAAGAQGPKLLPERLEPFELPDQHGETQRVDAGVRVLLFTRDMDGGAVVRGALETQGAQAGSFLAARHAVYVADVSGMPGIIRELFALPRMRGRPYPVLLDATGEATRQIPSEEGRATVIWLDHLRPIRVEFLGSTQELQARLGAAPAP